MNIHAEHGSTLVDGAFCLIVEPGTWIPDPNRKRAPLKVDEKYAVRCGNNLYVTRGMESRLAAAIKRRKK